MVLDEKADVGIDLFVRIMKPTSDLHITPSFGVQVHGRANRVDDKKAVNRTAAQAVREVHAKGFILAPIILMVFSMEGDRGYWSWVMEPSVHGENSPSLHRAERMEMTEISDESLDELFSRVIFWFEAMAGILADGIKSK